MPTKRNMKNYALVEVIQPKNYYEIVKAKLCHNVEEIILSYVFEDKHRGFDNLMKEVDEADIKQKPFNCKVSYMGYNGMECNKKVCKCHCCLNENTMINFNRAIKNCNVENGICMIRARRVIGREKAIPIPYYYYGGEYWMTGRDMGGYMMGLKPKDEVIKYIN